MARLDPSLSPANLSTALLATAALAKWAPALLWALDHLQQQTHFWSLGDTASPKTCTDRVPTARSR